MTAPLRGHSSCQNGLLPVLQWKGNSHLYGGTERNHCIQTGLWFPPPSLCFKLHIFTLLTSPALFSQHKKGAQKPKNPFGIIWENSFPVPFSSFPPRALLRVSFLPFPAVPLIMFSITFSNTSSQGMRMRFLIPL